MSISAGKIGLLFRTMRSERSRTTSGDLQAVAASFRQVLAVADGEGRNGVVAGRAGPRRRVALTFRHRLSARRARLGATERGVTVTLVRSRGALGHTLGGNSPEAAFDVVAEIFTQFSTPAERAMKWAGMRKALKPGGF